MADRRPPAGRRTPAGRPDDRLRAVYRPQQPGQETREAATAYVNPTPEEELTDLDRREIQVLDASNPKEFSRRVNEWVSNPDPDGSGERVFFSAPLVERTFRATGRLMADVDQKFRTARGNPKRFADLEERKRRLGEVRERAQRVRATLFEQRAAESPRRAAQRVVADVEPVLMRAVHHQIKNGRDPKELVAEHKPAAIARHMLAQVVAPELFEEIRGRVAAGEHPSAVADDLRARLAKEKDHP